MADVFHQQATNQFVRFGDSALFAIDAIESVHPNYELKTIDVVTKSKNRHHFQGELAMAVIQYFFPQPQPAADSANGPPRVAAGSEGQ